MKMSTTTLNDSIIQKSSLLEPDNNRSIVLTTTTRTASIEKTIASNNIYRTCTNKIKRKKKKRIEDQEVAYIPMIETATLTTTPVNRSIDDNAQEAEKVEISGSERLIAPMPTTIPTKTVNENNNNNYYYFYYFNKINHAYNSAKCLMLSIIATTIRKLSFLSRVLLILLLTLFAKTTTTTTRTMTFNSMPTLTTTMWLKSSSLVTLVALQLSPITATAIVIEENNNKNYEQKYANLDDVSIQQQPRQMQHQLFSLLKQQQKQQPDIINHEQNYQMPIYQRELLRKGRGGGVPGLPLNLANEHDDENLSGNDDDDDDDPDVKALSLKVAEKGAAVLAARAELSKTANNHNGFMETTGFVSDDGHQYEKVSTNNVSDRQQQEQHRLHEFATANSKNCPKACKCLNDFFDCSKLQLLQVPDLPDYVEHL